MDVSKKAHEVSTVMVASVPSVICALESLRPRDLDISSLCVLWRRKFLARMMSSVVDWRRKPRESRISSVVDWRRSPISFGECSLEEHVEEESGERGDREGRRPRPQYSAAVVDCRLSLLLGDVSRELESLASGERCGRESRRPFLPKDSSSTAAESGESESRRHFLDMPSVSGPSGERKGREPRREPGRGRPSSMAVDCRLRPRNFGDGSRLPLPPPRSGDTWGRESLLPR